MTARSDRCALAVAALWALALMAVPAPALPHAALLSAEPAQAIRLQARYDTGAPMAGAQVVIHAPDAPTEVWGRGVTDDAGAFDFLPDPDRPGRWTMVVRQAGHGAVAHVDLTPETGATPVAAPPQTPLQRAVMIGLVAWGALGTALWFSRGRRASA